MLVASSFFLSGCGGSSSTDPVVDTPQSIAIAKIGAYAEDQTQPVPTLEDYIAADVEGVTTDNLDDINELVASLTAEDVDTPEKIEAILDEAGLVIVDPTDPTDPTEPADTEAPVIKVTDGAATVTLGETYTDAGATATDNVDTAVTVITTGADFNTSVLGDHNITYTATDAANNTATATRTVTVVNEVPLVADGTKSIIIAPATASAGLATIFTVIVKDSNGVPLTQGGDLVGLEAVNNNSEDDVIGPVDENNGTYTFTVTHNIEKTVTYQATVNGTATPTVEVIYGAAVVGEANATTSVVEATTPVVANGDANTTITVTLKDIAGLTVITGTDTVTMASNSTDVNAEISAVTVNPDGTYTFTANNSVIETVTYTATLNTTDVITDTADVNFTDPTVPDITNAATTVEANLTSVTANGSDLVKITVTLVDGTGAATAGGEAITLTSSSATSVPSVATDVGDGTYTFTASNTVAETVTYTAVLDGVDSTNTASVEFVSGTPDLTESNVTGTPSQVLNDGIATATLTVTLEDSNGNTITTADAYIVTMVSDSGTAAISAVTANANGTYTFEANNTASETVVFTASVDGIGSILNTAEVLFTATPVGIDPLSYVGDTIVFTGVVGEFSFYPNKKFVKVNSTTREFEFIGTWEGSQLFDADGVEITVTTVESTISPIYNYPVVADKENTDPNVANVQGDGIREKNDKGISHVYFRDPDLSGVVAFSAFGFDVPTWSPTGGGGHWNTTEDGKVYAYWGTDITNEIATYAFDRRPEVGVTGNILTVTKAGDLMNVIVVDEYWQLKPPATDLDKTAEVAVPATMVQETFYDKIMLITDKTDGPSACYYDIPLPEDVNGYVICAGINITGTTPWGSKGDNWYINGDGDLEIKLHYDGPDNTSTTEIYRFDEASPDQGTLISKYNKEGVFETTSSISRFGNYK